MLVKMKVQETISIPF